MLSFIHLAKNVNATELSWYEEPILDACCRNIASSDELWPRVVETSILLLTCTQQRNPRSSWYFLCLSRIFFAFWVVCSTKHAYKWEDKQ